MKKMTKKKTKRKGKKHTKKNEKRKTENAETKVIKAPAPPTLRQNHLFPSDPRKDLWGVGD